MRLDRLAALTAAAVVASGSLVQAEAQFAGNFSARTADAIGEQYVIEVGGVLWNPEPEIVLATDRLTATGNDKIDFVNELGVSKTRFPELRVTLKAGRKSKLRLHYIPIKYEASTTLRRQFIWKGQPYPVDLPVNTTLDWKAWRFAYEYDAVSLPRGFVGIIGEVKYTKIEATLSSPLRTETADVTAPVPTIGGIARAYVTRNVAATFEMSGLKVNRGDFNVRYLDFDVYGTVNFSRNVGAMAGYRSINVTYTVDEDFGDVKLLGPYFAGVVRF